MSDFTIINGVAEIHNPQLHANWLDNEEFKQAVAESDTPERTTDRGQ